MKTRSGFYFALAFAVVIGLGVLTGCADFHSRADLDRSSGHVAFCGFARCDGRSIR